MQFILLLVNNLGNYLKLMNIERSHTIMASLVLGFALGARGGFLGSLPSALALALALLLIYGAGAALNNVSDAKFDGKSNPITSGKIGIGGALLFSLLLALSGLAITFHYGMFAIAVGIVLALSGVAYSYILRIKDRIECTLFLGFTHHVFPMALGYSAVKQTLDFTFFIFAFAIYTFIVGVILVKDFKDIARDAEAGRKNVALSLGLGTTSLIVLCFSVMYVLMSLFLLSFTGVLANPLLSALVVGTAAGMALMSAKLAKNPVPELGEKLLPSYRRFVSANFVFWAFALAFVA